MIEIAKLKAAPAYQLVSDALQQLILDGQLKPGDQLPGEVDLAARFGVNRSTLREGIRQLESEGLLRREGRKRLLISIPGHESITPRVERALLMHEVRFRELWEVAYALEPLAASLAAQRATAEDIAALDDNLARNAEAIKSGAPTDAIDTEFHALLAQITGNRALVLSREPIGQLLFRPYVELGQSVKQAPQRNLDAHRHITESVRAGNSADAATWMRRHIEDLQRGWLMSGHQAEDPIS